MTTNTLGNSLGTYECAGVGKVEGIDNNGNPDSFEWTGTLEALANCRFPQSASFKVNGDWHTGGFSFHSCGSPFWALKTFTVTCGPPSNTTPDNPFNPDNLTSCENGIITGLDAFDRLQTITFSGVASTEPTCDQSGYVGIVINGADYTSGFGYRGCGSTIFAIRNVEIECVEEPENNCSDCCRELLPLLRSIHT